MLQTESMIACKACSADIGTAVNASNDASIDITSQDCMLFRITCFSKLLWANTICDLMRKAKVGWKAY